MRAYPTLLAIVLACTPAALAQDRFPQVVVETPLRALQTADDLRGWEAVGRLDTGDGFCTATLIADDLVLTAAHCLFTDEAGSRRPDVVLSFNAGLRNGRVIAQRGIRQSIVHPDYTYGNPDDLDQVRTDLALLRLDRTIPEQTVRPFGTEGRVVTGDLVQVVSYGEDRSEYASLEEECEVLANDPGVLVLSCRVAHGSSGAPVLVQRDGQVNVVSVVSAMAEWRSDPVALSAELEDELVVLLDLMDREGTQFTRNLPQVRSLSEGNDGRSTSGARFIRP